jgi:putative ABC transport system ATP-binding protein
MFLQAAHLSKRFAAPAGTVTALDDVSLAIDAGQLVAICGESGCGKTTLLLVAGGLLKPDDGQLLVEGEEPYRLSPERRADFRGRQVGFVFQQFHLVPYLNVLENILTPVLAAPDATACDRAWELIRHLRLEHRAYHVPSMLSTGERQRTAIARAMLRGPRLLLADEPTGNLDRENAQIVLDYLEKFAGDGGAVLVMTHDPRASGRAQRCLRMSKGKLCPE